MNVLEGMKNMGETETVLFHGEGSISPPRSALLLPLFPHRTHAFSTGSMQVVCRQQAVNSKCFFPGSIATEGSCLAPAACVGSGKRAV